MTYKGIEIDGAPTLDMVKEYIETKKFNLSAKKVYARYVENGWKTAKGDDIKTLEAAINGCNSDSKKYGLTPKEAREKYCELLQTQEWKDFSSAVKKHYGNKCQQCGSTEGLEVHHNHYRRHGHSLPWAYYYKEMTVLCHDCHQKVHDVKIVNKV